MNNEVAKSFTILCGAVRALMLNRHVTPHLLDYFDSASHGVMTTLRNSGVDEKQLQQMEIAIAHLRLAVEQTSA